MPVALQSVVEILAAREEKGRDFHQANPDAEVLHRYTARPGQAKETKSGGIAKVKKC
jgi:hypothetical protein